MSDVWQYDIEGAANEAAVTVPDIAVDPITDNLTSHVLFDAEGEYADYEYGYDSGSVAKDSSFAYSETDHDKV